MRSDISTKNRTLYNFTGQQKGHKNPANHPSRNYGDWQPSINFPWMLYTNDSNWFHCVNFEWMKRKIKVQVVFGDIMMIHSDNLNLYISRLQKINNLIDNTLNEMVMDEWHINAKLANNYWPKHPWQRSTTNTFCNYFP